MTLRKYLDVGNMYILWHIFQSSNEADSMQIIDKINIEIENWMTHTSIDLICKPNESL